MRPLVSQPALVGMLAAFRRGFDNYPLFNLFCFSFLPTNEKRTRVCVCVCVCVLFL